MGCKMAYGKEMSYEKKMKSSGSGKAGQKYNRDMPGTKSMAKSKSSGAGKSIGSYTPSSKRSGMSYKKSGY